VLVGGYAGGWLSAEQVDSTPLTAAGLRAAGSTLGVGLVAVLPPERCPVAETARLVRWLAGESAGQCGPCWNGLPALADAMEELASTGGHHLRERLDRWAGMVTRRGACHHPDGVALLVRSLLMTFGEHVDEHRQFGWCGAEPPGCWLPVPAAEEPGLGAWR
jgi:NADH:ubiquinone oxidoreductase subunit F (NADH-binding)